MQNTVYDNDDRWSDDSVGTPMTAEQYEALKKKEEQDAKRQQLSPEELRALQGRQENQP